MMDLDVQSVRNVIQVIRDIATMIAAMTATVLAIWGINAWRRQLRVNVDLETARPVLRAIYMIREAVKEFRIPFHSILEISAATAKESSEEGDASLEGYQRSLYAERWKKVDEARLELLTASFEAEALWGPTFRESILPLKECIRQLNQSLIEYLRYEEKNRPQELEDWSEAMEMYRPVVQSGGDNDPFREKFEKAIDLAEGFLRPKVRLHPRNRRM